LPLTTNMSLAKFLKDQEIPPNQWDLLLFGDGSGLSWKGPGGYCVFLVDGRMKERACLLGARSHATVNRMELSAYVEGISYHYYCILGSSLSNPPYKVWVFSDSEYTVKCGSRDHSRKANLDLWMVVDFFESQGYKIRWRWLPRNSNPLHERADRLAGASMKAIKPLILDDNSGLLTLLPETTVEQQQHKVKLINCTKCEAPMLLNERVCPQCGLSRKG